MARQLISSGSTFEKEIGYSRAVVDGDWIFVSGTTGFDYKTMTIAPGLAEQTEQCLRNIEAGVAQAGSSLRTWSGPLMSCRTPKSSPVLADPAQVFRRGSAGDHDDLRRPDRPADTHRNRSHGAKAGSGGTGVKQ